MSNLQIRQTMPIPKSAQTLQLFSPSAEGLSQNFQLPKLSGSNNKSAVVPAIISAIASLAGAGIGAYSQHRANLANQQLAKESYRQNLLQWQRENAYNSPLAQRRRIEDAGFNSALMMQGAGSLGEASASSPQMDTANVEPLFGSAFGSSGGLSNITQSVLESRLLQEQIRSQQLDNDFKEETQPTQASNLRKEGELLDQKIVTETVNQALARIRENHEHMNELRDQARFVLESDKFDYELEDLMESIRGKRIDNDFAESTKELRKSIIASNAKDASNRAKLSGQEVEQEAKRIAVIGVMNEEMAIDQYLIDEYYSQYVQLNMHPAFFHGGSVKQSGTMSPYEWLESLTNDDRVKMLLGKTDEIYINPSSVDPNKFNFKYKPAKVSWSRAKNSDRYKNLYYKRLNTSNLPAYTQGVFSQSGSSSSIGIKGMSVSN